MKLRCDEIEGRLSAFLDDLMEDEEKKDFQEHIDTCEACENEYKKLNALILELNTLPAEPLPFDFKEKLHDRLVMEKNAGRHNFFTLNWKKYTAVAAGLMLVLLIRTGYYQNVNQFKTAYVDDAALQIEANNAISEEILAGSSESIVTNEPNVINEPPSVEKVALVEPSQQPKQMHSSSQRSRRQDGIQEDSIEISSNTVEEIQQTKESQIPTPTETPKSSKIPEPSETPMPSQLPKETFQPKMAIIESDEVMYSLDSESVGIASADMRASLAQPVPSASMSASSHDTDEHKFVSVSVKVDDFETVSLTLENQYNAQVINNSITLELNNQELQEVMNLLANYGAKVIQEENSESLGFNKCVISSK